MAEYLALDWERHRVCGVEASVSRDRVTISNCFELVWPTDLDPAREPGRAGELLRDELKKHKIQTRSALVALAREEAVVRKLELPQSPDDEVPDLVRFQAASRTTVSLDDLVLDYLPLPTPPGAEGRHVLMASVASKRMQLINKTIEAAGLTIASMGLSPIATAELVARQDSRNHSTSLVVLWVGARLEIGFVSDGMLLFTHATRLDEHDTEDDIRLLLSEVSRAATASEQIAGRDDIGQVWLIGGGDAREEVCRTLKQRLTPEVNLLDPLDERGVTVKSQLPFDSENLAVAVGTLFAAEHRRVEAIDFVHPRRPKPKDDKRKFKVGGVAAAAALVIAAGAGFWSWTQVSELNREIEMLQAKQSELQSFVDGTDDVLEVSNEIGQWADRKVNWLDEVQQLQESFPKPRRIYITQFTGTASQGRAAAQYQAPLKAHNRIDIHGLNRNLDAKNYRVRPRPIEHEPNEKMFPDSMELDVEVMPQDPAESADAALRVTQTAPGTQSEN